MTDRVRQQPCQACPYRRDVPSGVWAEHEYAKLPPYDAPTAEQPFEAFACHASTDFLCHGWAVVHDNQGQGHELLALRLHGSPPVPGPAVPLFASGKEAAEHGLKNMKRPTKQARQTQDRLLARYPRLRKTALPC